MEEKDLAEKTAQKRYVYRGKILNLRCDDAYLPDGRACKREIVEHSGGAAVLCVLGGKIAFVKQYRYAYGEAILEIPAGKVEQGEDPRDAARRELEEEAGVRADVLQKIAEIFPSPGYTDEIIHVYRAENAVESRQRLDDGEFLSVEWLEEAEAKKRLFSGEFKDAKTIVALQDYFLKK